MAIHQAQFSCIRSWSITLALGAFLGGCGGGGGGPSNLNPNPPPGPTPTTVTVSGKITFDRIPFDTTLGTGLNPNAPVESPARGVVVEAISGSAAIANTITDAMGDYSLTVPANTQVFIRAKAQILKTGSAPTWNFRVLNNTNADALYALDGSTFNSGTGDSTRNLRAGSGWNGTSYGPNRAAAPFAILDTVYQATQLLISASPSAAFSPLNLYWSSQNRPTTDFCVDDGAIGTSFYSSGGSDPSECTGAVAEGIYILGNFAAGDTDEFDQHVIAHEFGHYVEAKFSRSDSIGGNHGEGDKLDLRVAFGEGWGNAFAGMVLNDPVYRDSFSGMSSDFGPNLEQDDTRFNDGGWFSETSVGEILWDLFDSTNESGDSITLGFAPIFAVLTDGQRTTSALTSIFSFLDALRDQVPSQVSAINQLRNGEQISATDEFGMGETNNGGDASTLPVYRPITLNSVQSVCVRATNGTENKLGYIKFFRLDLSASALVTITAMGAADQNVPGSAAAVDPDIYVHRQGEIVASGVTAVSGSETIDQISLPAATYIIEVLDFELIGGDPPRCMTVNVTGA